ncbi:MAG: four helix bundle protein [Proteobacteria bacterium]|nr:four helix bundle protein [Pseudomonadota bacterium]MBU1738339.1 four helix bundle protein [Pseudomonadota bacterium]
MNNREFAEKLEARTLAFAVRIIRLSTALPKSAEANVVKNQITKSGTSIGANYREANRARSKADFKNKIKICESEASETNFWLEVMTQAEFIAPEQTASIQKECLELLAIFTSIGKGTN